MPVYYNISCYIQEILIDGMQEIYLVTKIKYEKAKDFIGWVSPDGNLKVIGIDKKENGKIFYKVTCEVCSPDTELYPEGYFISQKSNLINGSKPCGCSLNPKWKEHHYNVRSSRICNDKNLTILSVQKYKGKKTRVILRCNECTNELDMSYDTLINSDTGCVHCWNERKKLIHRTKPHDLIQSILLECKRRDYLFVGFEKPYKNNSSKFLYFCKNHGLNFCSVANFTFNHRGCPDCAAERKFNAGLYGYYPKRKDEQDFLYVLRIDDYIKVGRSFKVETRIGEHKNLFKSDNITLLYTHTSNHKEIFDMEQYLLKYLKSMGYLVKNSPSPRETFRVDCEELLFSKIKEVICGRG